MTNKEVINFLGQVRKIILDDKSWLESTIQPINEAFDMAINALTAQPETHDKRTETHACDCVSRQAAIDAIEQLPSAQPEIVMCGQCKYAEVADAQDNQDGYTCRFHRGSIWFSGSYCSWAERRSDEGD